MVNERNDLLEKKQDLPRHLTEDGIVDELANLIFAGTDTTSNTLTYLFWELSRNPEWQEKLRAELNPICGGGRPCPSYDEVSELPILDAVVQETLRLHPAALSGLPREVPEGGAVIAGVPVPEGVSSNLYARYEPSSQTTSRRSYRASHTPPSATPRSSPIPTAGTLSAGLTPKKPVLLSCCAHNPWYLAKDRTRAWDRDWRRWS